MNQLIKGSIGRIQIFALLVLSVALLVGCGSKPDESPAEAAPAAANSVAAAPESVSTGERQDPQPSAAQSAPAYDSTSPAFTPPSSVAGSNGTDPSGPDTTDGIIEPVVVESEQSDLFVEREAIDALGEELFLEIISPDEDVAFVESSTFVLTARTVVDAAVSINDDLVDIDEEGILELELTLEEGPNIVEVVTSLASGEEMSAVLTIFYLP